MASLYFPLAYIYRNKGVGIIISQSKDGEIISLVVRKLGYVPLRGSSTRGGGRALAGVIRMLKAKGIVAITPDGPKGPLYSVKEGVVSAANICSVPIIPISVTASPKILLKSWDKMVIPMPFAKITIRTAVELKPDNPISADDLRKALLSLEIQ